ncbi:MAG: dicarboxylate/amino acid:cation symporter [Nannocystis sp.]|nr:dicarboxylate/amino acid:cation symporter [Nannocystis sp.]MBA3548300.1 dicarboxylate/amino acid:cation symporter [Nannocystis sp.]
MPLHSKILLGLALGAAAGIAANLGLGPGHRVVAAFDYFIAGPVGQVFLRMLSMVVMPLVFASIALGVAGVGDVRRLGRMGARTLGFFIVTTALATGLGLALVRLVQPGTHISAEIRQQLLTDYASGAAVKIDAAKTVEFGMETLVGIVTRNPIKSAVEGDMLGIIFFGLVFGAALTMIRDDRRRAMVTWLEALADVVTTIIDIAMRIAPYGVAGLIFGVTSRFGFALLAPLGVYVGLVLGALLLHAVLTMSVLIRVLVGLPPLLFFRRIRAALVTAFSTSSSSASLPTNLRVGEQNLGLPAGVCGFVYPLGATMCMNGTALFEGITVIFLCQVFGVTLDLGQMAVVMGMAVLTSIGAAAVPGGSIPLMVGMLAMFGVPPEGIAVILGVDRILDMARTAVNVLGDHTAAAYIARSEGLWQPHMLPAEPTTGDSAT